MFIQIKTKVGSLCWINLKQVLIIRLGRPADGWIWEFEYSKETIWSETFETKEAADAWLSNAMNNCKSPQGIN